MSHRQKTLIVIHGLRNGPIWLVALEIESSYERMTRFAAQRFQSQLLYNNQERCNHRLSTRNLGFACRLSTGKVRCKYRLKCPVCPVSRC